ncbi:hypothetical protein GCM10009109_31050 [Marinobacterium sediminicola]
MCGARSAINRFGKRFNRPDTLVSREDQQQFIRRTVFGAGQRGKRERRGGVATFRLQNDLAFKTAFLQLLGKQKTVLILANQ